MELKPFDAAQLNYELPAGHIAQAPLPQRETARLLCLPRAGGALRHQRVRDLQELLAPSLIVLNDTRVIPARLLGHKPSGGQVELLLVERTSQAGEVERWIALAKGLRVGARAAFGDGAMQAHVLAQHERTFEVELRAAPSVGSVLLQIGRVPLPPYITRGPEASDVERYQTVYAAHDGAVAAPTAGLHISDALLSALRAQGHETVFVTLHVGPGTFAPLREDDLAAHAMHPERYEIPDATALAVARAREQGRQVLAVGTTVVRALEAAASASGAVQAGAGKTSLFVYPPFAFRVVDAMMTNFHLPRSTLLALVMAFGGVENVRRAYRTAIDAGYRFYSYGDAMLIGGLR
jgi:S-adenosylmethionine:tRNA ribosyltransferase-isomerase